MSLAVKQGQLLTQNDLPIYFQSKSHGCCSDPYVVVYDYMACDECGLGPQVIGVANRIPVKFDIGAYYPAFTIDSAETVGPHKIVWKYKETSSDNWHTIENGFDIIPKNASMEVLYSENMEHLIYELRKKLRDINPDRDYSVVGEEEINILINDEVITLTIEELYNIIYG